MLKEPFFEILDVSDHHGRSMADIAAEVIREKWVSLETVRGERRDRFITSVRRLIISRFKAERADLSSEQIGRFLKMDPSTVRYHWRGITEATQ